MLEPPAEYSADLGGVEETARLIGPAMRGWVYRTPAGDALYRLIPMSQAPVRWRYALQADAQQLSAEGIVRPDRDWQTSDASGWYVVRYAVEPAARTLQERLASADAGQRIKDAAQAVRAFPGWWTALYRPILPTAAEIVLTADGAARYLWIPQGPLPDAETVFADARRGLYLAPELVRAAETVAWREPASWEMVDRYALGAILLQCFFILPEAATPETTLARAANGTLLTDVPRRSDLPPWFERLPLPRRTLAALRQLSAPDPAARWNGSLATLADWLETSAERVHPQLAALELRDYSKDGAHAALSLLQEVFPLSEMYRLTAAEIYELLVLAGELAAQSLFQPLEALDYFERAMGQLPDRKEAYAAQLRVILAAPHSVPLRTLVQNNCLAAAQLDGKAWRNFQGLSPAEQPPHVPGMARYLLWRGLYQQACQFVFPRLTDAAGVYHWWDFDLNLAYVEALGGLDQYEAAEAQLQIVKQGLLQVRANRTITEEKIKHFGGLAAELERWLHERRRQRSAPPSPASTSPATSARTNP